MFNQMGSNTDNVFSVDEGERIQIQLKASHHWPANETPFKGHFAGVSTMAKH